MLYLRSILKDFIDFIKDFMNVPKEFMNFRKEFLGFVLISSRRGLDTWLARTLQTHSDYTRTIRGMPPRCLR